MVSGTETVRVSISIEPRWTSDHHTEVIEVDVPLGASTEEREAAIFSAAEDAVSDAAPWGYQELADGEGDEDE
jgi:hypothetical protein